MSYIAFDLDALNRAPAAARAAGVTEDQVISGLVRLWAWCFREKTDQATALQIRGHFGADCADALAAFGFLEPLKGTYRVKGADRYLRVTAGRSKGGKAAHAAGNLLAGSKKSAPANRQLSPSLLPAEAGAGSQPFTDDRRPTTDDRRPNEVAPSAPHPLTSETRNRLVDAYEAFAGSKYKFRGPIDGKALKELLAHSEPDEIVRRFHVGLKNLNWPKITTIAQLNQHWNALTGTVAQNTRAPVAAESVDWSKVQTGEMDL